MEWVIRVIRMLIHKSDKAIYVSGTQVDLCIQKMEVIQPGVRLLSFNDTSYSLNYTNRVPDGTYLLIKF